MALHKLDLNQLQDESYSLIAIHCSAEDYRMAYLINKYLKIKLARNRHDLDFEYTLASYPIYSWEDEEQQIVWSLVGNICKREENMLVSTGLLFDDQPKQVFTHNLIPEYEQVNYFLKIDNDSSYINDRSIISAIHEIPQVAAVYSVSWETLRSKDNLIFN